MTQPEKTEQAKIVQLLRSLGAATYVFGVRRRKGDYQGTMQSPGVPDVLAFLPARAPSAASLLWVECKVDGRPLRAEQRQFRDLCRVAGVDHVVGDLDAVVAWLIAHDRVKSTTSPIAASIIRSAGVRRVEVD